ncbi:unnamed protein product [Schistosoma turkestanicum]|nr:unnamed protein product [Schistosoma turkestanicum]
MVSQPVLPSFGHHHGHSTSENLITQSTLLNTTGLNDLNHDYLPFLLNNILNQNHHQQNDGNNVSTHVHHHPYHPNQQQTPLIQNNSDLLNLHALQIPLYEMVIANRNNNNNNNNSKINNSMINMTTLKNSENNHDTSFTNFTLTSSLTKAISSNVNLIGPELLPICTPLLQLAIRHALAECFPPTIQLHIKGRLEISMNTINTNPNDNHVESTNHTNHNNNNNNNNSNNTISTTTLFFNDETFDMPEKLSNYSNEYKPEDTNAHINNHDNNHNHNNNNSNDQNSIYQQSTASRRKPLHPSKCYPSDIHYNSPCHSDHLYENHNTTTTNNNNNANSNNNYNLLQINQSMSPLLSTSSPTSPSSDSGVLDLSHGGSLADSAPITPLKEFHASNSIGMNNDKYNYANNNNNSNNNNNTIITDDHYQPFNLHDQLDQYELQCFNREQDIIESYKKQLAAFNQIQAVWKMSTSTNNELFSNCSMKFNMNDQQIKCNDQFDDRKKQNSEPNTPAKLGRRTRVNIGQTGRLTTIRRPSTNRRFPCNQCKEEFPSLHTLEQHTLSQHGTYRCHICQAQFTQRSNLQRHALKHVGFKPFECRVCSKAYYRKDHLMRHMEMGHPGFTPRDNITVHLTSSESLDYLNRSNGLADIQSIPENYDQQRLMYTDETMIEKAYHNDNENVNDVHQSTSPLDRFQNTDSVYSPTKDQMSSSLPEESTNDSTLQNSDNIN